MSWPLQPTNYHWSYDDWASYRINRPGTRCDNSTGGAVTIARTKSGYCLLGAILQTDRGGQITYHGPGQLIVYTLLDLQRLGIGVRELVNLLEHSVIKLLTELGIKAERLEGAPGVYVAGKKIAALGLRVRRHSSYHGLSLNIDMDLAPFAHIDPCGYRDMQVIDLRRLGVEKPRKQIEQRLLAFLVDELGYTLPSEPFLKNLP